MSEADDTPKGRTAGPRPALRERKPDQFVWVRPWDAEGYPNRRWFPAQYEGGDFYVPGSDDPYQEEDVEIGPAILPPGEIAAVVPSVTAKYSGATKGPPTIRVGVQRSGETLQVIANGPIEVLGAPPGTKVIILKPDSPSEG